MRRAIREREAALENGTLVRKRIGGGWVDVPSPVKVKDHIGLETPTAETTPQKRSSAPVAEHFPPRDSGSIPPEEDEWPSSREGVESSAGDEEFNLDLAYALAHAVKVKVLKVQERVIEQVIASNAAAQYVIDKLLDGIDYDAPVGMRRMKLGRKGVVKQTSRRWFRLHTPPALSSLLAPNGNALADMDVFEGSEPGPTLQKDLEQQFWDIQVQFEMRETDDLSRPFRAAPAKIINSANGPVHILHVRRHREIVLRFTLKSEGCRLVECDRCYWGGWSVASTYPAKIENRRRYWSGTMTGDLGDLSKEDQENHTAPVIELGIVSSVPSANGTELAVTVDWPEPTEPPMPITEFKSVLLVPLSFTLFIDQIPVPFRLKALLATHTFDVENTVTKRRRYQLLIDGQQDCLPAGSYRVRAKEPEHQG
jgi:hypothetical protein